MILDLRDMISAARSGGYALPVFQVAGVALARAAVEAAEDLDSPVVLHPVRDGDLLMPALVALANRARVPVAAVMGGVSTPGQAAEAIRLGAHGLILGGDRADPAILPLAEACAVAIIAPPARTPRDEEPPAPGLGWFGDILDGSAAPVTSRIVETRTPIPWPELVDLAAAAARGRAAACMGRAGASGRVAALAKSCRRRREVEHVVLYNPAGITEDQRERILEEGVRVLGAIPGVRRVFVGRAVAPDGRFTHAWLVRLAAEGVVALYRGHPDHLAFADRHFRPMVADRVTVDFIDEDG